MAHGRRFQQLWKLARRTILTLHDLDFKRIQAAVQGLVALIPHDIVQQTTLATVRYDTYGGF